MREIVINSCFGGFSLSLKAFDFYNRMGGTIGYSRDIPRDDPSLVQVVKTMGERANGQCARLRIVEIPDDVQWHIHERDGLGYVAENHRTWS